MTVRNLLKICLCTALYIFRFYIILFPMEKIVNLMIKYINISSLLQNGFSGNGTYSGNVDFLAMSGTTGSK